MVCIEVTHSLPYTYTCTCSEHEARETMRNLLETLAYLHGNHIVHRDIKPENFLLADRFDDSNFKLIDFGFATYTHGRDLTTIIG